MKGNRARAWTEPWQKGRLRFGAGCDAHGLPGGFALGALRKGGCNDDRHLLVCPCLRKLSERALRLALEVGGDLVPTSADGPDVVAIFRHLATKN